MEKNIKKLSKYGLVKTCKLVTDDVATIVLTDGFSGNAMETFDFMKDCQSCFPEHTISETCITEKNFAMIILTKKIKNNEQQ